jgi:hypothetical protein
VASRWIQHTLLVATGEKFIEKTVPLGLEIVHLVDTASKAIPREMVEAAAELMADARVVPV